jgi:hypothetical protein
MWESRAVKLIALTVLLCVTAACNQQKVAAADPRDAEIVALKARVAELEAQHPKHQYSVVYPSGGRPLRFDSVSGTSCVLLPPGVEATSREKAASCSCADEIEIWFANPTKDKQLMMNLECGGSK